MHIFEWGKGSGKRLLANLFAMSLQCQNRDEDGDACGKCQSCKQAASNNQPDIIRVTHENQIRSVLMTSESRSTMIL